MFANPVYVTSVYSLFSANTHTHTHTNSRMVPSLIWILLFIIMRILTFCLPGFVFHCTMVFYARQTRTKVSSTRKGKCPSKNTHTHTRPVMTTETMVLMLLITTESVQNPLCCFSPSQIGNCPPLFRVLSISSTAHYIPMRSATFNLPVQANFNCKKIIHHTDTPYDLPSIPRTRSLSAIMDKH